MREKIALYPFTKFSLPVVRHFEQLQNQFSMHEIISWPGCGLGGKDASVICNHPKTGIIVTNNLNNSQMLWDMLVVDYNSTRNIFSRGGEEEYFYHCCFNRKRVSILCDTHSDLSESLLEHLSQCPKKIDILSADARANLMPSDNLKYGPLDVPVLFVGGLIDRFDSLEVVLALKEFCSENGRIVSCITSTNLGLMLGIHSYSHIFANNHIDEYEKMLLLNQFARCIIQTENPELLIVEAPDPFMKFNRIIPNGFGIKSYMVAQSLNPTHLICCMPFEMISSKFIEAISQHFLNIFGCGISAVQASNVLVDSMSVFQDQSLGFIHVDLDVVQNYLRTIESSKTIPVYDIITSGPMELCKYIISSI